MSSFTLMIGLSVAKAALPNVAGHEPGPERNLLVRRLVTATLVLSAIASIPVALLASPLIRLFFGPAFHGAAGIARVLLLAAIALSTNRSLEAILRGIGRPLDAGVAEFVALGATAAGLAVFLPLLGLMGAAVTSALAYLVSLVYMTRRVSRALEIPSLSLFTPDPEVVAAVRSRLRPAASTSG